MIDAAYGRLPPKPLSRHAMELRHLRYFVALSESLHFGEAAARLRIAQPSLSQQIRQLEEELQTTLLQRTKRRVELTEAGELLLEEARDILARADRAALIARRAGRGEAGRIRVGVGYCMDQMAIVKAICTFNRIHVKVRVELETLAVSRQIAALRNERLDVGFVRYPVNDGLLTSDLLLSEPLVVAMPATHRFAGRKAIPLSELAEDLFVMTSREMVPFYHDVVLKACREAGFVPNAPHETDQLHLLLGMVAAGSGVALVPAFVQRTNQRRVAFASLRPTSPNLTTVVAWRQEGASALLTEFITIARRTLHRRVRSREAATGARPAAFQPTG